MNRIFTIASLLCSLTLAFAACEEAPQDMNAYEGSGDLELKRIARPGTSPLAPRLAGVRPNTTAPADDAPDIHAATYDLGIGACAGMAGGLSMADINGLRDCCQDAGCGFVQSTTRIDGHLCAEVSCNCGPDELNATNYLWGENDDDLAFLDCAGGL